MCVPIKMAICSLKHISICCFLDMLFYMQALMQLRLNKKKQHRQKKDQQEITPIIQAKMFHLQQVYIKL